jgi:hypothetical protein
MLIGLGIPVGCLAIGKGSGDDLDLVFQGGCFWLVVDLCRFDWPAPVDGRRYCWPRPNSLGGGWLGRYWRQLA